MPAAAKTNASPISVYTYEIVQKFAHDKKAFTQGLVFKDGFIYESTGLPGRSSVRRVDLETGEVLHSTSLALDMFGEGLTTRGDDLVMVTWKSKTGFVFNPASLLPKSTFNYEGEAWGLASSPTSLYLSDGTPYIRVLDPVTLKEERRFQVTFNGKPVKLLNELEWVEGELLANVWKTDLIVKIDPKSGKIRSIIDLTGLLSEKDKILEDEPDRLKGENVLNGIAYDKEDKRLFVTGKLWPYMFEINLVEK